MRLVSIVTLALAAAPLAQDPVRLPAEELEAFEHLDDEGRFVLVRGSLDAEPSRLDPWIAHLGAEGELEVLELLALYGDPQEVQGACAELGRLDAPQWIRACVWTYAVTWDSHSEQRSVELLQAHPGLVRSWFAAHPDARTRGGLDLDAMGIEDGPADLDVARYLPALTPEEVYAHLEPTGPVLDHQQLDAARAELVTWTHQVVRAIGALAQAEERPQRFVDALRALLASENPTVVRAACLAYAHFEEAGVPIETLDHITSELNPIATRQAALIGFSYGPYAAAYVRLQEVALDPSNPLWDAAISRLVDLGDGYTAELLAPVRDALEEGGEAYLAVQEVIDASLAREERLLEVRPQLQVEGNVARRMLEVVAFAYNSGSELTLTLEARAGEYFHARLGDPEVLEQVKWAAGSYTALESLDDWEFWSANVTTHVRYHAGRLLEERAP